VAQYTQYETLKAREHTEQAPKTCLAGSQDMLTGPLDLLTGSLDILNMSMIMLTVFLSALRGSLNSVRVFQDMVTGSKSC
jgi:hypothetical protein